jgi:hypothetical protein
MAGAAGRNAARRRAAKNGHADTVRVLKGWRSEQERGFRIRERPGHGFARDGWGQASAVALRAMADMSADRSSPSRFAGQSFRQRTFVRGADRGRRNARSGGGKDEAGQGVRWLGHGSGEIGAWGDNSRRTRGARAPLS